MTSNNTPESFSGAHPYRPQCVIALYEGEEYLGIEIAEAVTAAIDSDRCPRCDGPLPTPPHYPAGSRVTRCRCVPVCPQCGFDEAFDLADSPEMWPIDAEAMRARSADLRARMKPAMLTTEGDEPRVITEEGSTPVEMRPHPGGWAEFGYDDSGDRSEQEG